MSQNPLATVPADNGSPIPGLKIMLCGGIGSGKTTAIRTALDAGLEVFVIFTEPSMTTLSDLPTDKVHWHYLPAAKQGWGDMISSAKKINTLSFKALAEMGDIGKSNHKEFIELLTCLSDFTDDRTGVSFGPVDSWGTDRILIIDSLSGISMMAMHLVTGSKPVKSLADWGVAIDNLERLVNKLCMDLQCHFAITAHMERETDEVSGGIHLMPSTLGRKLPAKMGRYFDEVLMTRLDSGKYYWAGTYPNADLKSRHLPSGDKHPPSYAPLISAWKKRGGVISSVCDYTPPVTVVEGEYIPASQK